MKALTKQSLRDYVLTKEQQVSVLSKMTERDRLLLEFLFSTGVRISEALGIQLNAVKKGPEKVSIVLSGKGNKVRQVRVPVTLYDNIRNAYRGKFFLFETYTGKRIDRTYVWKRVNKAAAAVGLRFSPHCARHTFATHKIAQTGKITAVSRYLGHSSPSITLGMYTHETLSDEELGIG